MRKPPPPKPGERDSSIARVRFAGEAADAGAPRRGKLTAGVPRTRFVKPRLLPAPELVLRSAPSSEAASRYHRLVERLEERGAAAPRILVVTGPEAGEGKSVVATNLALAYAVKRPGKVLLVDADLHRPHTERWLRPLPEYGLAELLAGRTELEHVLIDLDRPELHVLPAGRPPREPLELLVSAGFEDLMQTLRQRYHTVVVDTPSVIPFSDADLVGRFADGALIVVRAGRTRRAGLQQAIGLINSTPVLGVLVNDVAEPPRG